MKRKNTTNVTIMLCCRECLQNVVTNGSKRIQGTCKQSDRQNNFSLLFVKF